ncbi:hypothetical protein Tco_0998267, partial [Tanacetum coccineum]
MQAMQEQIQELLISQNHREDSASSGLVNKRGAGSWHPNDIKVDILEYDGKLDPDEFVEWLRTVKRVFDYKQTIEDNKDKNCCPQTPKIRINMVVEHLFEARTCSEGENPDLAKDEGKDEA